MNTEIARQLREIAKYLGMEKEPFRSIAYYKAADVIEQLSVDVSQIYSKNNGVTALQSLPGIGEGIAKKIEEYIKTGKISYLEELKKQTQVNIAQLSKVEGLGPKRISYLYNRLNIKSIKDLETAAKTNKITPLPGFGEKTQNNLLEAITFLKNGTGRILLNRASILVEKVTKYLNQCPQIKRLEIAGSFRRKKETIGDLDFLAVSQDPKAVMNYFIRLPGVVKVLGQGSTKASVKVEGGVNVDLRVVPKESFGAALQYFTGSKEHNIAVRQIALDKGYKLNEYGLFKGNKRIAGKKEIEIYEALGLCFIEPELRVNKGEIERAKKCFRSRTKNRD